MCDQHSSLLMTLTQHENSMLVEGDHSVSFISALTLFWGSEALDRLSLMTSFLFLYSIFYFIYIPLLYFFLLIWPQEVSSYK